MNSEKIKEIKKVLEQNTKTCLLYDFEKTTDCKVFQCKDILDYINELESENERLILQYERVKADNEMNCLELKDRIADLESELEKEQINNLNCDTELQYKEKRIVELEKENEELLKENEGYHGSYRCAIDKIDELSAERYIKVEQFAERLKESLEEYRLENEYFTENEPNGNLWQMNASVFCIEVTQDGGLIDQIAKECLNETN